MDFVGKELHYRLCKIQGTLTSSSALFYRITLLSGVSSLSSEITGNMHLLFNSPPPAKNFSGHEKKKV